MTIIGDQEGEDDYHFDDYTDEGRLMLQHATRVVVFFCETHEKSSLHAEHNFD